MSACSVPTYVKPRFDTSRRRQLFPCKLANTQTASTTNPAPERFCDCPELIIDGKRQPCPPHHNCQWTQARTALVREAAVAAPEKCGDPTGDKGLGRDWTKIFNADVKRLVAQWSSLV